MSKKVQSIKMDDQLSHIRDIFNSANFHHLVVVEHNKVVGIISDRDYLKLISPRLGTPIEKVQDSAALNIKAHQIMNRNVCVINLESSVHDLITKFHQTKVSCLPVVDDNQELKGIVSWRDVMDLFYLHMQRQEKS